jgi:hypothetical protein
MKYYFVTDTLKVYVTSSQNQTNITGRKTRNIGIKWQQNFYTELHKE